MKKVRLFGMMDEVQQSLKNDLLTYFPNLSVLDDTKELSTQNFDITFFFSNGEKLNQDSIIDSEIYGQPFILVGKNKALAYHAIKSSALDFLLYPYEPADLISVVTKLFQVRQDNGSKANHYEDFKSNFICVPCLDGYEFINLDDIMICEGMQSYTKIIMQNGSKVVCSNNIGELRTKLAPHNFFSPHKSYLINLNFIRKYSREGVIYLSEGFHVPLARRRKTEFLNLVSHL